MDQSPAGNTDAADRNLGWPLAVLGCLIFWLLLALIVRLMFF